MPEGEANVTEASRSRADEDDHEIPNARLKSIDDGAGRKQRNGNGNTVQEPFAVRKARLLQELEDLKKREEELNNEDELRELERELEAVRKRIRDREMKVAHETTHVTSLGEQLRSLLLATTDVGLNSVVPQTTAVGRTETRQRNSVTATDSKAQASHLTRNTLGTSVHEFGELEYYKEVDSDKSQSFQDMDIPELRRLAANEQDSSQVEGIKKATSIIHIHYSIFSKTGAIEDLERAIQLANEQMPVDDGSPSYATQLKNLVVMLVKKYRCTNSMSDLQEAIFRAQEMVAATPLAHSSRSARVKDFITMMLMKFSRTGSQDALDEATITAREVGASISVDSSGGRGLVIKVGIPELSQALSHNPDVSILPRSRVQDVAESGVSTSLARRGSCRSSCSTCSKIISVLSAPYGEKSKIALGKFSDVLATECFHSESLQCLEFDSLTRFKKLRKFYPPHSCQDPDFLIEKLSNTDYAVFRKNCDACSSLFFSPLFNHKSKPTRLAAREHEHSKAGRARLMDSQWIDVNVVQNWLTCCEQEHGSKCAEYKIRGLGTVRPEWLIDTIRGCISPSGGQPRRYVALSYTWGQVKMFLALKSNIEELQRPGVLLSGPIADQIPKTIRDAIGIARCLRVPFLWTDCLCIVQDDKKALYNNLRQMHLIYSNSVLTIIVENGRDANHGIRGIYEVSDPRSIQETRMKIAGGEMLVSVETDYVGNPYSEYDYHERMWTFQEYYFSKRRLVFGSGPVVWECNKASWSEHLYPYPTEELGGEENAISSSIRSQIPALDDLGHITLKFNTKVLSHHQDVLFAFSGIQTLLSQRKFPGGLLYGLPEFNFDNALVWHFYVSANRTRRRPSAQFRGDPTQDQLPSWSWMGWQGSFDFLSDSEFECEPHGFTQLGFRAPVTKWHTMDSPRSENRRAIESRWYNFRSPGSNKNVLLDGWSQSYSKTPSGDESASKISYSPVSEPGRSFWYPVPLLLEPIETKETKTQTQYLYCETSRAFLCQSPMRAHKSIHWDRVIKDREGKRIGGFQLCWKAENMLDSSHGSQPEQIELVAIVKGWVLLYAKMDTPGISDSETLPTTFSFWDPNDKEGPDPGSNEGEDTSSDEGEDTSSDEGEDPSLEGEDPSDWTQRKFDCYFVLAIKWKDDIAYREGVGFVFEAAWERFKEAKPLCLVLG